MRKTGTGMRTRSLLSATFLTLSAATVATAQDEEFVVIKAGTVITVSGEEIPRGEIVIVDGKIRLVGVQLEYPAGATVIDARRETVMPGWVNPYSRHGLTGYSRDGVHGDWTIDHEVYLDEIDFDSMLAAGYTSVALYPDGSSIPGVATVYRTAAPLDLDEFSDDSQRLLETSYLRVMSNKSQLRGALVKAKSEIEKIKKAREEWDKKVAEEEAKKKAEAEKAAKEGGAEAKKPSAPMQEEGKPKPEGAAPEAKPEFKPPATDAGHQPLMDWINGELAVMPLVSISSASRFLHFEEVMKDYEDLKPNLLITGNSEFTHVVDELAKRDAILLTTIGMYTLPQTSTMFNFVAALESGGADIALMPENARGGGNRFRGRRRGGAPAPVSSNADSAMRTVRVRLANLVRAGLGRETAIEAVTINAAKVAGVADRVGTIEAGKDADLIFLNGDALDPLADVTRVMILGAVVWEKDQ